MRNDVFARSPKVFLTYPEVGQPCRGTLTGVKSPGSEATLRREVSKNETFWHDSDPWRIFSTSSRGLWAFPRALTYIYGIPTSFVVEPACATVTSPQSEV